MRQYKILSLVTMALFLLVFLQQCWHFVPVKPLKGAWVVDTCPRFGMKEFLSGEWQKGTDRYVKDHHGFREPAIRLYNQFVWGLFGQSTNGSVVKGREGWLYERYFVEDHYQSRMYEFADEPEELLAGFDAEARRLALLQRVLDSLGTTLFVQISPGKDIVYPEYLPPQGDMDRPMGPQAYKVYPALFDRYGVRYTDICAWFLSIKDSVPYRLMPQTGTHWSNIAAVYAFDSVMRYMHHIGGPAIPPVSIGHPYAARARGTDYDMGDLLNVVFPPRGKGNMYVDVKAVPSDLPKPKLLVIGASFFWNILDNFPLDQLFTYTHYWFYNNTVYYDPDHDNVSQVNLAEALREADYVMLSYCTSQLYSLSNNFSQQALAALGIPSID